MSYLLQNDDGQVAVAHSISAGLDYPGVGPEHAYYRDTGRFEFVSITDEEALEGFQALTRLEGIMPALESAHAIAHAMRLAKTLPAKQERSWSVSPAAATRTSTSSAKALGEARGMTTCPYRRRLRAAAGDAASAPWSPTSWPAIPRWPRPSGWWSRPSAAAPT